MGVVGGLWIAASLTIDAVPAAAAQAAGPASLSWAKLPPRGTAVHATPVPARSVHAAAVHATAGPKHRGTNRAVRARPATSSPKSAAQPAAAKPAAKAAGKSPAKPAAKPTAKPAGKPTAKGAAKPAPKPSAKPAAKAGARPTLALPLSTATGPTATGALSTGAFSTASLTRPLAALPVLGPFFPLAPVPGGPTHGGGGPLGILNGPGVAFPGRDLFHFRLSMLSDGWAGHSLQTATRFKLPISLLGAAVIFFLVQALIDRRDPKVSGAPERPHEDSVGFQ
jgi:hypothetical protein